MTGPHRLVLGTLPFALLPPTEAFRLLDTFVEAGGAAVDTASMYGFGHVETLVGAWLRRVGPVAAVNTKIGYFADPDDHRDAAKLADAVGRSVERLGVVPQRVLLHEADWACWWRTGAPAGAVEPMPPDASVPAWCRLRELANELGFRPGLSGNHAAALGRAARQLGASSVLVAKQYDLLWRDAECLLTDDLGEVLLAAPFHQGRLFDLAALAAAERGNDPLLAEAALRLSELLGRHGVAPAEVALPWVLSESRAAAVCVGVANRAELDAVLDATSRPIDPSLRSALARVGIRRAPMPGPALGPEYLAAARRWSAVLKKESRDDESPVPEACLRGRRPG
ncbi:aldo/keto reductase [Micromonospora sp. DT4]|uniref:aldo/keto reductase n=1 Tax=Micromonospora sp. DT4 TaxID=3393438 RepID=UPI003CF35004